MKKTTTRVVLVMKRRVLDFVEDEEEALFVVVEVVFTDAVVAEDSNRLAIVPIALIECIRGL